jgi:hypothetical protein
MADTELRPLSACATGDGDGDKALPMVMIYDGSASPGSLFD